jgi:site-specific recombinase XerD
MKEFLEEIYLPFYGGKWKGSTKMTTEQRLRQHIMGDLGQVQVSALDLTALRRFLQIKAERYSASIVRHLRFDLKSMFRMALAKGIVTLNPTPALYAPKARQRNKAEMDREQVLQALEALSQHERLILHLADSARDASRRNPCASTATCGD